MTSRATRADARRSRRLLLEAGAAAFTDHGLDVQVSEITRRAGLAKGTFFRHFATKRALLVEILTESIRRLTQIADRLAAEPADDSISRYMTTAAAEMTPLRAVIENAILHGVDSPSLHEAMDELLPTLALLVTRAQAQGELREDVTALDIHIVCMAATSTSGYFLFRDQPELWRRYLALALDALRPEAAHPLPIGPPSPPAAPR